MYRPTIRVCTYFVDFVWRSHKIEQADGAYPPSISLPLFTQLGQVVETYPPSISLPIFTQIGQVVKAYPFSIYLPLFRLFLGLSKYKSVCTKIETMINGNYWKYMMKKLKKKTCKSFQ